MTYSFTPILSTSKVVISLCEMYISVNNRYVEFLSFGIHTYDLIRQIYLPNHHTFYWKKVKDKCYFSQIKELWQEFSYVIRSQSCNKAVQLHLERST